MKRRKFIKTSSSGILAPAIINGLPLNDFGLTAFSPKDENDHVLILIYLEGGNDGLNTVIPIDQLNKLNRARGNITIKESSLLKLNGSNKLMLHPSLSGFQTLYNENKLCIVQSVGYPTPSFSHVISTNIWASAMNEGDEFNSGWIGRFLSLFHPGFPENYPNSTNPDPLVIQFDVNLPLMFHGTSGQMSMRIGKDGSNIFKEWPDALNEPVDNSRRGRELKNIRTISRLSNSYSQSIIESYTKGINVVKYPSDNILGNSLQAIARLIKGGSKTRIFLVNIPGFDTHSSQVDTSDKTKGLHSNLLKTLGDAVLSFQRDLEGLNIADRVIGMTFSEFGRRIQSNTNSGTDHGTAAPSFLFGSKINGGIIGSNPTIPSSVGYYDNLPMQYDFRSIYTSVLKDWFCVQDTELSSIMLKPYPLLPIIKSDCSSNAVNDLKNIEEKLSIVVSPNPVVQQAKITISSIRGQAQIQLFDYMGRMCKLIFSGKLEEGTHTFIFENENYSAGNYYLRLQHGAAQRVEPIVIIKF